MRFTMFISRACKGFNVIMHSFVNVFKCVTCLNVKTGSECTLFSIHVKLPDYKRHRVYTTCILASVFKLYVKRSYNCIYYLWFSTRV